MFDAHVTMGLLFWFAFFLPAFAAVVGGDFGPLTFSSLRASELPVNEDVLFSKYVNGSEHALLWVDPPRAPIDDVVVTTVQRYFAGHPIRFHRRSLHQWSNDLSYRRKNSAVHHVDLQVVAVLFTLTPKSRACLLDAPPLRPDYIPYTGELETAKVITWIRKHSGFGYEYLDDLRADEYSECRRVTPPTTPHEFLRLQLRGEPLIFTGAARLFFPRAFAEWDMDYLLKVLRNMTVGVKVAPSGIFEGVEPRTMWDNHRENLASIPQRVLDQLASTDVVIVRPVHWRLRFDEFWRLAQQRPFNASFYVEYFPVSAMSALSSDIDERLPFEMLAPQHRNIWIGDGRTLGKLHFDQFDNILAMVRGEKTFHVLAPNKRRLLREGHLQEAHLHFDLEKGFTRPTAGFAEQTGMTFTPVPISSQQQSVVSCRVMEGDMLYLPAFAWHEVHSSPGTKGTNVALNNWYHPLWNHEFPCASCGAFFNAEVYSPFL